jgi:alpha-1,6-mannosyltransferase
MTAEAPPATARAGRASSGHAVIPARAALASLVAVYVLLAAAFAVPGSRVVLATAGGSPDWLLGPLRSLGWSGADGPDAGPLFYLGLWLAMVAYVAVLVLARGIGPRLAVAAIVGLNLLFLLAPPLLSQDVFSYISYARLGTEHGLNPYDSVPAQVPADPAFAHLGWPTSISAYGPLFTLLTYPLGPLGLPAALWVSKASLAAAALGLVVLTARLAPARGLDSRSAWAFVGFNPLLLVHVVGGPHNEGLMMLLLLAGIAAVLAARPTLGGGALLASAAVKVSGAFALPFALVGSARSSLPVRTRS